MNDRRPAAMPGERRGLLYAALAAVQVKSREPELAMVHAWLDSWSGLGAIVVGMRRHGYELRLDGDEKNGGWKASSSTARTSSTRGSARAQVVADA